ncbi:MAG: T9SS type A sorting domain-containing protein [Flavobacterium sp.]|uniref:PQQ-dependent sugar dehydrogenase n=1 Tax=Flavobacterium sp. TaxID=239 RepID=UPI00122786BF|nr:PQQ-dependent sugar dehydrogenase [Flavobacterium sp.]RZJ68516.1 MAG: T9SS type A sorting domain-containing protein [Flavobacterium sp.]
MKSILFLMAFAFTGATAQTVAFNSFASGFSNPVAIAHAGDSRLFVVQLSGAIRVVNAAGVINTTNFLTLTNTTVSTGGERGLLGLAFHPNYNSNGYFYVYYTRAGDGALVISRYTVSGNPDVADATSGTPILVIPHPGQSNHNGGSLAFGPDGYLYIGTGDGGGGGDQPNNAQNTSQNLGKMLRIDVDSASPYGIPSTNPYVGVAGNDEIFLVGLRNPWKWSFDKSNGDLWIADVGQGVIEEINRISSPVTPGLNLGWRCYEGTAEYNTAGCAPIGTMTMPLTQYSHTNDRCSITGGYVYRGTAYPNLQGTYFFADYCTGEIGTVNSGGDLAWLPDPNFGNISTFGEDVNGQLYVNGGNTIYKIVDSSMGADDFARHGMKLYPNPTDGEVYLEAPNLPYPAQFRVYESTGKIIIDRRIENTIGGHFVTGDLARGVYMVRLEDALGNSYNTKLAVE